MLQYLHSDHLGSTTLTTDSSGNQIGNQTYRAYGLQRGGDSVPTENQFTGQKQDGSGLQYFAARYYDPQTGLFVSPDTIVPDAGLALAYNRSLYTLGNPLKFNDPTGHETSKPDWWPDFLPYSWDLPDGMTQAEFIEWLSENNMPTTWGFQVGGDMNLGPYIGTNASIEGVALFNWLSGEIMYGYSISVGAYTGSPDIGADAHGGLVYYVGASRIDKSILGLSDYHTAGGEVEALGLERGISATLYRGRKNLSDNPDIWVPGGTYIDPKLDRTVDGVALNVSAGLDMVSVPMQKLPYDVNSSNGLSETRSGYSWNLYSTLQSAWNWLTDW